MNSLIVTDGTEMAVLPLAAVRRLRAHLNAQIAKNPTQYTFDDKSGIGFTLSVATEPPLYAWSEAAAGRNQNGQVIGLFRKGYASRRDAARALKQALSSDQNLIALLLTSKRNNTRGVAIATCIANGVEV
jgi:hypothetical protein